MSNWMSTFGGPFQMSTGSATGSSNGNVMVFAKTDGNIYVKNTAGSETVIGGAPGDTTYTVTVADCENTTTKTNIVVFTVPANTWLDGEAIWIEIDYEYLNNSGATRSVTSWLSATGITEQRGDINFTADANVNRGIAFYKFVRLGTSALTGNINFANIIRINYGINPNSPYVIDTSVDYTTNITFNLALQFPVESASLYVRPMLVRAYKKSAGQQ
jgi:hypothetical protein